MDKNFQNVSGLGAPVSSSIMDQMNAQDISKLDPEDFNTEVIMRHRHGHTESAAIRDMRLNVEHTPGTELEVKRDMDALVNLNKNNGGLALIDRPDDKSADREAELDGLEGDYSLLSPVMLVKHLNEKKDFARRFGVGGYNQLTSADKMKQKMNEQLMAGGPAIKKSMGRAIKNLISGGLSTATTMAATAAGPIGVAADGIFGESSRAVFDLVGDVLVKWAEGTSIYKDALELTQSAHDAVGWTPAKERIAGDVLAKLVKYLI